MERGSEDDPDRESTEDESSESADESRESAGDEARESGKKDREDDDSPGPSEPSEEEEAKQREEDTRQARERLEEVRDAPLEEHAALKAGALGSTIILVGALFIVFGVIVALAFSPWGWLGVAIGVGEVIIGQLIRTGALGSISGD